MVGIHYLAWVDDLDAGTIVLIQRHEEWMAAIVDSSMYPSKRNRDSYTRGYECPEAFMKVSPRGTLARLRAE